MSLPKMMTVVNGPPRSPFLVGSGGSPSSPPTTAASQMGQAVFPEDEIDFENDLREHIRLILCEDDSSLETIVHLGLDACGVLFPGGGELCDLANVILYAKKGDWLNAAFSLVSVIPEVGDLIGKGGKFVSWVEKEAPKTYKVVSDYGPSVVNAVRSLKAILRDNQELVDGLFRSAESDLELAPYVGKMRKSLDVFMGASGGLKRLDDELAEASKGLGEVNVVANVSGYTLPLGDSNDDVNKEGGDDKSE